MPKNRAKGERVTITAPLVPVLQQIQERKLLVDLSETVNWIIRCYFEDHPELLPSQAPLQVQPTNFPEPKNPNSDLNSILKELS
jgi:hypothetical protein